MASSIPFYHLHFSLTSPAPGVCYYISLFLFPSFSKMFCPYVLGENLDSLTICTLTSLCSRKQNEYIPLYTAVSSDIILITVHVSLP